MAFFFAQIGHESNQLRATREYGKGEAYDVGSLATTLGNTPEDDGDGERLKGRGLIQLTGTTMYKLASIEFGVDFIAKPELLEGPHFASLSAGWFWKYRDLNSICDKPEGWVKLWKEKKWDPFSWVSIRINGYNSKIGEPNGLAHRRQLLELSTKAFTNP